MHLRTQWAESVVRCLLDYDLYCTDSYLAAKLLFVPLGIWEVLHDARIYNTLKHSNDKIKTFIQVCFKK